MNKTTFTTCSFPVDNFIQLKKKVLNWTKRFSTFCFLDNHFYQVEPHSEECLLAAGIRKSFTSSPNQHLEELQQFIDKKHGWLFGHLGYDLKNETESLSSGKPDYMGFPDVFFFEPEYVIRITPSLISIEGKDPKGVFNEIKDVAIGAPKQSPAVVIKKRFKKEEYVSVVQQLKKHILRGDCYEINFCQEFYAEKANVDPIFIYERLSSVSPNPFSALYRHEHQWLICASPERFLRKEGDSIISQPMKGTSRRMPEDTILDIEMKRALQQSTKDRSENVMVVDLVRNDLAKICEEGSVKVDELFGVYTFPQVHQMISTISGQLQSNISFTDIIRATFPMGSMTGAPKKRVMELIEQYEKTRRGIFSGSLGYIGPNGDFDFNVIIRSIMLNTKTGYLSFQAGSGITWYSDAEKEWEECLLKASAIEQVLK